MGSIPTGTINAICRVKQLRSQNMTTQAQEKGCDELCQLLDEDELDLARETVESDSVVMEDDGTIRYRDVSHPRNKPLFYNRKKEELRRKRKELVLGMGDCNKHTLAEANAIIEEEWQEFESRHRSPVGKFVTFIRARI